MSQLPSWAKSQSGEVGSSRKQRGCAQGPIWDSERRRPCSAWTAVPVRAHVRLLSHVGFFCDPVDYSPTGSSVHGDSPGKNTGVGCHALL